MRSTGATGFDQDNAWGEATTARAGFGSRRACATIVRGGARRAAPPDPRAPIRPRWDSYRHDTTNPTRAPSAGFETRRARPCDLVDRSCASGCVRPRRGEGGSHELPLSLDRRCHARAGAADHRARPSVRAHFRERRRCERDRRSGALRHAHRRDRDLGRTRGARPRVPGALPRGDEVALARLMARAETDPRPVHPQDRGSRRSRRNAAPWRRRQRRGSSTEGHDPSLRS